MWVDLNIVRHGGFSGCKLGGCGRSESDEWDERVEVVLMEKL